jgi:hypothetical protein
MVRVTGTGFTVPVKLASCAAATNAYRELPVGDQRLQPHAADHPMEAAGRGEAWLRISRRETCWGGDAGNGASRVWLPEEAISQPALQVAPGCLPIDPQLHPERHHSPVFISDMEASLFFV